MLVGHHMLLSQASSARALVCVAPQMGIEKVASTSGMRGIVVFQVFIQQTPGRFKRELS